MSAFVFTARAGRLDCGYVTIAGAVTWFTCREVAREVLETDALSHEAARSWSKRPRDLELRFVGNDYAHGGSPDARRLQRRTRVECAWGPWEDAR